MTSVGAGVRGKIFEKSTDYQISQRGCKQMGGYTLWHIP
jgi:hypothetical protein